MVLRLIFPVYHTYGEVSHGTGRFFTTLSGDTTVTSSTLNQDSVIKSHRLYFDQLAREFSIRHPSEWYKVKLSDVEKKGGTKYMKYYGGLSKALQVIYPEFEFLPWMFERVPAGYWDNPTHHRKYFDWLAKVLNISKTEQWYHITQADIIHHQGAGLLKKYNNTLTKALMTVYPDYNWKMWLFNQVPPGYWEEKSNIKSYLTWLAGQLNITKPGDWSKASHEHLSKLGAGSLLLKYGGIRNVLQLIYPSENWEFLEGNRSTWSKSQTLLAELVTDILQVTPADIKVNYKHPALHFSQSTRSMELDIYIPSLALAFEYQGEHHYQFHYLYGSPELHQQRDQEKRALCQRARITLIEIPYWWNKEKGSLLATIHKCRPDLIKQPVTDLPIPDSDPKSHLTSPPNFPFLMGLPWKHTDNIDPTGWWVSSKISGLRAIWTGKHFRLLSDHILHPPSHFVEPLLYQQHTLIDGVLRYMHRGNFPLFISPRCSLPWPQFIQKMLQAASDNDVWKSCEYHVIDFPSIPETYEKRMLAFNQTPLPPYIKVVPAIKCMGKHHLQELLDHDFLHGGNGLILRNPISLYHCGISPSVRKITKFEEGYAKVLTPVRHQNVRCAFATALEHDVLIPPGHDVPDVGTVVRYRELSTGVFEMTHVRNDRTWRNVLELQYPYHGILGKNKGQPKCFNCKVTLPRNELQIQVQSFFAPSSNTVPHATVYHFCTTGCVTTKLNDLHTNLGTSGAYLPPFDGRLFIPSEVLQSINPTQLKNMSWISDKA